MHMQVKPKMVLDARKAFDSGIGTYIRNLIPFLKKEFTLELIGAKSQLELFDCKILETNSKAYSISDFYLPSKLSGTTDIFWTPHFNYPLLPPKTRLKVSTVYDLYHKANWDLLSLKQKLTYTVFLENVSRQADVIFTISDFTKEEITRFYPRMLAKTHVIHLGVDFDVFKPKQTGLAPEVKARYSLPDKYILFVGNLKPNKNIIALLKAYKLWIEEKGPTDIKIVITGKKDGFRIGDNEAVDYINSNGLENNVSFTGFVEEVHLPVLYQNAWLFVFPSLYEGFGLPPLEAMACGCPVTCSKSASIPEICQDKTFYFDGHKPEELKDLFIKFNSNQDLLNQNASIALDWVKRYNWELTAEKHINILHDELKRK